MKHVEESTAQDFHTLGVALVWIVMVIGLLLVWHGTNWYTAIGVYLVVSVRVNKDKVLTHMLVEYLSYKEKRRKEKEDV